MWIDYCKLRVKKSTFVDQIISQMNRVTFLGTGTSQGVPMIGCDCNICQSLDPKDKRLRSSVLVEYEGFKILIDCGPDFRQQMLREGIKDVDAIILTHQHKDHMGGLDDIRAFNYFKKGVAFPIYAESQVLDAIKIEYAYAFTEHKYPGVPEYKLIQIDENPFKITKEVDGVEKNIEIAPIRVMHYKLPILGFRFGEFAYITDANAIPDSEYTKLKDLNLLVLNAIHHKRHISHFNLDEAIEQVCKIGAKKSYLTHFSHQMSKYNNLIVHINGLKLPFMVEPAYDGLVLEFTSH